MPVNQIVTPLDSAVLDSKEQYSLYFKIVDHALKELVSSIKKYYIFSDQESVFIKQYCELLIYSIEAMRIKYLYDKEALLKIDLTESGFPNYLELRYLYNDLLLRNEYVEKLPNIEELRNDFLDQLLRDKKHISDEKLHQASSIIYYTTIDQNYIFKRFIQGKIIKTTDHESEYVVSWCFYDISLNRPFICFMYFNYSGKRIEEYTKEIYEVLKNNADRNMNLDAMAFGIDKKLSKVKPRKIRRIDLGPIHSVFAKDENVITHAVMTSIVAKETDLSSFVLSLNVDQVHTKGSFKEGKFLSSQELQIWNAEKSENYLFASHRTIQMLYDKLPMLMDTLTTKPFEVNELTN
ncbi:hypothetical protein [Aquimarina sp. MMG016]|uniref:hypothetical protein n=1 Tax=Aquimarina sp. MMG016 TaxID=2822690 RepID=UPI001B3A1A66|nr:hypothetical protein [Aquimarina sp. MMG016]MBQ4820108.1 hypothetical protein [Aquimarina sp. MMG016]